MSSSLNHRDADGTGEPAAPATRPPRRGVIFGIVALALFMSALDVSIVATALPALQRGLDASITSAAWVITAYGFGMVVILTVAGKLADRFGRRRIFLLSVSTFGAASLLCGTATDVHWLVAFRVVQAWGGAGLMPAATGIVVEHFGRARDKAVGLFGSIFPVGFTAGPVLGGVIVTHLSWRAIFLVNVPIAVVIVVLGLRFIPGDTRLRSRRPHRWDLPGVALIVGGLLAAMIGVTNLGSASPGAGWISAGLLVLAGVACAAFVVHINRVPDPVIPPKLIHGRGFGAINVVNIVDDGAVAGMMALLPLYAVTRYNISTLGSGTLLVAQSLTTMVVSGVAAMALRRSGFRMPIYFGVAVIAIGLGGIAMPPIGVTPYTWLSIFAGVVGLGVGAMNPACRNACLQLVPDQAASLAALRSIGRQIGQISAVSVASAVIAQWPPGHGPAQAWVYAAFAILLVLVMPVIHRVPEHRGAW